MPRKRFYCVQSPHFYDLGLFVFVGLYASACVQYVPLWMYYSTNLTFGFQFSQTELKLGEKILGN